MARSLLALVFCIMLVAYATPALAEVMGLGSVPQAAPTAPAPEISPAPASGTSPSSPAPSTPTASPAPTTTPSSNPSSSGPAPTSGPAGTPTASPVPTAPVSTPTPVAAPSITAYPPGTYDFFDGGSVSGSLYQAASCSSSGITASFTSNNTHSSCQDISLATGFGNPQVFPGYTGCLTNGSFALFIYLSSTPAKGCVGTATPFVGDADVCIAIDVSVPSPIGTITFLSAQVTCPAVPPMYIPITPSAASSIASPLLVLASLILLALVLV